MSRYAKDTEVSADRSRALIERELARYGATSFQYGWEDSGDQVVAAVGFRMHDRMIRFVLPMPSQSDPEFTHTPSRGTRRSETQAHAAWEKATRQRWRALHLVVKAKLEAVESEISTFEEEFLSHIVLPNGKTVAQMALPEIERAYSSGRMPRRLLLASSSDVVDAEIVA